MLCEISKFHREKYLWKLGENKKQLQQTPSHKIKEGILRRRKGKVEVGRIRNRNRGVEYDQNI
jgi:hypothetical protein